LNKNSPLDASQTTAILSLDVVTILSPLGEKDAVEILSKLNNILPENVFEVV
jgi:hypothetical protein